MSAPNAAVRDSQEIGYGFLAARASIALRQALDDKELSSDDVALLVDASEFLKDISDGALITTGSVREGVSASRSIAALDVAFGPLETLKQLVKSEAEIAPLFQSLSQAVGSLATKATEGVNKQELKLAEQFFSGLSSWLLEELSSKSRSARGASAFVF